MRRLIINADDFGLTCGVNRGIIQANQYGAVTSATLMASGAAFEDAITLAHSTPRLRVGCHVVLVDGKPLSEGNEVSSLIKPDQASGARFRAAFGNFALHAIGGKLMAEQIEIEAITQIRKIQAADIKITHFDTHKHTHMFPQVLRPLLVAAKKCGIRAVRNPFDQVGLATLASYPSLFPRWLSVKTLRAFSRTFRREVQSAGFITPDGSIGIAATGSLTEKLMYDLVRCLPEGTWELVCHPGINDSELNCVRTRLRSSRQHELAILTSSEVAKFFSRQGVELISFEEL